MPYRTSYFLLSVLLLGIATGIGLTSSAENQKTNLLIIAPHPDDAVLCCAGLIQQSVRQGKTVRVVNVTDGDGYQEAAASLSRKPTSAATTTDMLRLGRIRRKEEIKALRVLGIPKTQITFLGYPDGLLEEVYGNETDTPLANPFTRRTHTPAGMPFTKTAVISDLRSILIKQKPQLIYVTGMNDTALDHQITYRLVMDAINKVGFTGKLLTYTIHTKPDDLAPSPTTTVQLTRHELLIKGRAIKTYQTQMVPDDDYIMSFAQGAEAFY